MGEPEVCSRAFDVEAKRGNKMVGARLVWPSSGLAGSFAVAAGLVWGGREIIKPARDWRMLGAFTDGRRSFNVNGGSSTGQAVSLAWEYIEGSTPHRLVPG